MKIALVTAVIVGGFLAWYFLGFLWFVITQLIKKKKNGRSAKNN